MLPLFGFILHIAVDMQHTSRGFDRRLDSVMGIDTAAYSGFKVWIDRSPIPTPYKIAWSRMDRALVPCLLWAIFNGIRGQDTGLGIGQPRSLPIGSP